MKVKELVQLFDIHSNSNVVHSLNGQDVNRGFRERAELVNRLGKRIHQYQPDSVEAEISVRDLVGRRIFENMGHIRNPQLGLFLSYEHSVELPQAYHDLQSLKLGDRARLINSHIGGTSLHDGKVLLEWGEEHNFMFHMNVEFSQKYSDIKEQVNGLYVAGKGNPSLKKMQEVEKLCRHHGATCEIKRSGKSGILRDGVVTSFYDYPHFFIRTGWNGSDFDIKAIELYGDIRALVFETHKRETLRNVERELDRKYHFIKNNPTSVIMNQERSNGGPVLSDLRCSLSADLPFVYKKQPMQARLSYYNFVGT